MAEDEPYNEDIEHCENSTCGAELEEGRIGYCDECIAQGYGDDEEEDEE